MQTFLPFRSFLATARALDDTRLNNQINEATVILKTLLGQYPKTKTGRPGGWPHHPATKMWRGYEYSLMDYRNTCIHERLFRGQQESRSIAYVPWHLVPPWLGDERLHRSHRSNLIRKLPDHYRSLGWSEPDNIPYWWPTCPDPTS